MLTASELEAMRTAARRALIETCVIQRKVSASDGGGGTSETWADNATNTACRVAPAGGGETGTAGDRVSDETTHIITLPSGTDVTEADRLKVDGQAYEVTAVRRRGVWEVTRRVEVREVP